jgi:hypothetical protein
MKCLRIVFCILLISSSAHARKLNFIETHLLRLSSQQDPTHWLLPFKQVRTPRSFESNVMLSMEKDTYSLYEDIQSKKQDKIQSRLQESFGQPYDVSAKINFGYRYGKFAQFFSINGGAALLATDPVFPELKGFLFHDYTATSSFILKPLPRLMLKPQISYGVRKTLDREYSVGDLVDKSLDVKFNEAPYIGFLELNVLVIFSLSEWGQLLFEVNSLPLMHQEFQYWDSFLGYKTPNFLRSKRWFLTELAFYGGYSPFYGGEYDVSRTYKLGLKTSFAQGLEVDFFTMDDFYPAGIISWRVNYLTVEAFSFERAYDDFGNQKSRQYGLNLKVAW